MNQQPMINSIIASIADGSIHGGMFGNNNPVQQPLPGGAPPLPQDKGMWYNPYDDSDNTPDMQQLMA